MGNQSLLIFLGIFLNLSVIIAVTWQWDDRPCHNGLVNNIINKIPDYKTNETIYNTTKKCGNLEQVCFSCIDTLRRLSWSICFWHPCNHPFLDGNNVFIFVWSQSYMDLAKKKKNNLIWKFNFKFLLLLLGLAFALHKKGSHPDLKRV